MSTALKRSDAGPPEVLVMAGGEGRRLGALAARTPKPMLPVGGRPALQNMLEHLRDQGVRHAYLSVCHLSHVICEYFGDGRRLGIAIEYVVERRALGTAGALGLLPPLSHPLLVVNGDVVTSVPVADMGARQLECGAAMSVGYVEQRVPIPYGVLDCVGPDVVALREKPEITITVIAGVYLVAPEVVAGVRKGVPLAMPELIAAVLATRRVLGYPLPGPWLDIGTPDTYARADQVAALTAVASRRPTAVGGAAGRPPSGARTTPADGADRETAAASEGRR